ncbi:MAG: glycosyltransferase family 2 protein [Lachnospiraceae bacterium]|nr:glycosyltransferase family 2 protein [Lachnospiraceae bacterium]
MKIYAGIVTYNPNIKLLMENINSISCQVEKLIIVDNASNNVEKIDSLMDGILNGLIIHNVQNKGIAHALNLIMKRAYEENSYWVLLLDQDSICPPNLIKEYLKYINNSEIAVITPRINDINDFDVKYYNQFQEFIVEFITSGSLNRVDIWNKMGGFNEDLFIDMVDYDYAYRLNKKGYKVIKLNNIILNHAIGKRTQHNIAGIKCSTYNHNAFRKYYITRNSIYLAKMYPEYCNIFSIYLRIVKRMLLVVFFEEDKCKKIINMLKGIRDSKKIITRTKVI